MKITVNNLVSAIDKLPKDQWFDYMSYVGTKVKVVNVIKPNGPIIISRYNPKKGQKISDKKTESISTSMLTRISNYIVPEVPFLIDRILGASYNTRSALECLLAHTPEFSWAQLSRIEISSSSSEIKPGHKHLIYTPDNPHPVGQPFELKTNQIISELPVEYAIYDEIGGVNVTNQIDIDIQRRHLQIQVALIEIGKYLGFRTWIAHNDKGFTYGAKKIGSLEGVVNSLKDEKLLSAFPEAQQAAWLIDCIWFRNGKFLPAVIEIEHSTGITSGLTRMKTLYDVLPPFPTRYVIVAPDEDREKAFKKANVPQFHDLDVKYFSYSAVEELYSLCKRRKINKDAVNESFIDCFMERCVDKSANYLN